MNGILGKFHLNNHNIAVTLMKKFTRSMEVSALVPREYKKNCPKSNSKPLFTIKSVVKRYTLTLEEMEIIAKLVENDCILESDKARVFQIAEMFTKVEVNGVKYATNNKQGSSNVFIERAGSLHPMVLEKLIRVKVKTIQHGVLVYHLGKCCPRRTHPYSDFFGKGSTTKIFNTAFCPFEFFHLKEFCGSYVNIKLDKTFNSMHGDEVEVIIPLPQKSIL